MILYIYLDVYKRQGFDCLFLSATISVNADTIPIDPITTNIIPNLYIKNPPFYFIFYKPLLYIFYI